MLKTSFPDHGAIRDAVLTGQHRGREIRRKLSLARARRSNAPHVFLTALDRESLCRRLLARA